MSQSPHRGPRWGILAFLFVAAIIVIIMMSGCKIGQDPAASAPTAVPSGVEQYDTRTFMIKECEVAGLADPCVVNKGARGGPSSTWAYYPVQSDLTFWQYVDECPPGVTMATDTACLIIPRDQHGTVLAGIVMLLPNRTPIAGCEDPNPGSPCVSITETGLFLHYVTEDNTANIQYPACEDSERRPCLLWDNVDNTINKWWMIYA